MIGEAFNNKQASGSKEVPYAKLGLFRGFLYITIFKTAPTTSAFQRITEKFALYNLKRFTAQHTEYL